MQVDVTNYTGAMLYSNQPMPGLFEHYGMYVCSPEHVMPGCMAGMLITDPNGHVQFETPVVMRTKDGGQRWERSKSPSVNPANDVWAVSADEPWLCARRGYGMQALPPGYRLHTTDGRKTWSDEAPGNGSLWNLTFPDKDHGFASGGAGGGVEAESTITLIML